MNDGNYPAACQKYKVKYVYESTTSLLMFIRHAVTNKHFVIKKLEPSEDMRFNLKTPEERQRCQVEALRWNRVFTPRVYLGLARFYDWERDQDIVIIDQLIKNPTLETLERDAEYVLVMRQLPNSRRLDHLLDPADKKALYDYGNLVTEYVAYIHKRLTHLNQLNEGVSRDKESTSDKGVSSKKGRKFWGSPEQLRDKLEENLLFVESALVLIKKEEIPSNYKRLKEVLLNVFKKNAYKDYFEQRQEKEHIKHCHGDIKARNIWITQYTDPRSYNPRESIKLLDAIDFNTAYSNIDILSDFAMLVIDIEGRTKSELLGWYMIQKYLTLMKQFDPAAEAVLNYYLVEKALVCAAVSIIDDKSLELGETFLELANKYIRKLT